MILPKRFPADRLALPLKLIYWSCKIMKNDWLGVALVPSSLVALGIALLLPQATISSGMWLALLWAALTFPMLYYGVYRVQRVFDELSDVIPNTEEARYKEERVRASVFALCNKRSYYIVGALVIAITFPSMYGTFVVSYPSRLLQSWSCVFFVYMAFVGGYGMACGVAYNKMVDEMVNSTPFALNPYHPDLFMGLKPLGQLSVIVAFLASSASLLFPLIFETTGHLQLAFLGYLIFGIILCAIVVSFVGPLLIIKRKIEREKFAALVANEREYQARLDSYKKTPTTNEKDVLELLLVEKAKLREIRLFPFETKMMFQIVVSILLPIVMLFVQLRFK